MSMMLLRLPPINVGALPQLYSIRPNDAISSLTSFPLASRVFEFHSGDLLLKSPPTTTCPFADLILV